MYMGWWWMENIVDSGWMVGNKSCIVEERGLIITLFVMVFGIETK